MKIFKNTIWIFIFAYGCNILLRSLYIPIDFSQEDYSRETAFSATPYFFGDAEHSLHLSSSSSGGNIIAYSKNKSQNGTPHQHLFGNFHFKSLPASNFLTHNRASKTFLDFFSSSWYKVFGLRKIII